MKRAFQLIVLSVLGAAPCFAQQPGSFDTAPPLSGARLDALTAPIALYPDALIAQILTAATYPLEVAEAAQWLEDPANGALRGDTLAAVLEQQGWDLSVKSLVPFPDTLRMMERNPEWTEQIGDAFLAQQPDVMDSIQRLRRLAISAGTLSSTPQQTIATEDGEIIVEPAGPDVVYVPYYNPTVVYGPWPWTESTPFFFPPPPGIYVTGPAFVFGVGFAVVRPLWGWSSWSWSRHGLFIHPGSPHTWPLRPDPWRHDPNHRRGVPYRDWDHQLGHTEHPLPGRPPRSRAPAPGDPWGSNRDAHPRSPEPPSSGGAPRHNAPPPGQPQGEHPPRQAPSREQRGRGTELSGHRPGLPDTHPRGDDRARQRPPSDHPRSPTGPPAQGAARSGHEDRPARGAPAAGTAGSRAQSPTLGAPRGGHADRPARGPAPTDRPTAPRGREPPPKPQ